MKGFLEIHNKDKILIKKIPLTKLPLKKEYITEKSKEIYFEEDPCIIYQTSIINKFGLELYENIESQNANDVMYSIDMLNKILDNNVELPETVAYGRFI